ncbi:hypothetical protein R1sor_004216 [Riccia sorocarpa]|uniref:Reverse transcriptase domain-containing protein n=1 Tax=Riccia sorocarpa TaxID=122646 RepID=A0ABD3H9X4_9MARC
MSLTYKIVSKILANRVRSVLPQLVDSQQTGFIMNRLITDNVLSLKLGQEWATWLGQKALFFKLDFIKAYDRVNHSFLWSVLQQVGFDHDFISLVQGFTCDGTAKVHVNGGFSREIRVECGVRQGCPLAPLLFALCSQPFMCLLREAERAGRIKGLEIEPGFTLLHQLFADDTGVCLGEKQEYFEELLRILGKYEQASGAKINIQKSMVMPLGGGTVPDWVRQIGCEIAEGGRIFKYLGIPTGVQLTGSEGIAEALRRMNKRILQWENFYLPWAARLVLIKHVLTQIPSYILLAVGCSKKDANLLERCCRQFLWGINDQGKLKKSLIAWKRLVRPKAQGGLGLLTFEDKAWALQMRVWFKGKKKLQLSYPAVELPGSLPIASLKWVWGLIGQGINGAFRWIEGEARRRRVVLLEDILSTDNQLSLSLILPENWQMDGEDGEMRLVGTWLELVRVSTKDLWQVEGWKWKTGRIITNEWRLPNQEWSKLWWSVDPQYTEISVHWRVSADVGTWTQRWSRLWKGKSLPRHKIWLWRVVQQGIPTMERATKWGYSDGNCAWCNLEIESVEHVIWECPRLQSRVQWLSEVLVGSEISTPTFLQVLDHCLQVHHIQPSAIMLLSEHCRWSWLERNKYYFEGVKRPTLEWQLLGFTKVCVSVRWQSLRGDSAALIKQHDEVLLSKAHFILLDLHQRNASIRAILREGMDDDELQLDLQNSLRLLPHESSQDDSDSSKSDSSFRSDDETSRSES